MNVGTPGHAYEFVRVDRQGQVAILTIDNQRKANAFSLKVATELGNAIDDIARDEDVRGAIITGAGRNFVGGADIGELRKLDAVTGRAFIRHLHKTFEKIRDVEKPVIAAVNGPCLGAGLDVAICCDMVVASDNAVFGMPEVEVGVPTVIEAAMLVNLIGAHRTKEFLLTCDRWDAARAERVGLVNYVVSPEQLLPKSRAILDRIAHHSPTVVALQKDLITRWMTTDLDTAIEYGINAFGLSFATGDPQEALNAFAEKRPTNFAWRRKPS